MSSGAVPATPCPPPSSPNRRARMIAESPTPDLPRGAGGPLCRAAGRGSGAAALVLDPDPLTRLLVAPAVAALGFAPVVLAPHGGPAADAPVAVFVSLDRPADCRRVLREAAPAVSGARLVAGYGAGPEALLSAHRAHRCCDVVLRLTAAAGRPRLVHLPAADAVSAAGLSDREADVLVLLLLGLTTPALAARLGVADSTARSHCRAVLRKLGAPDRRALRARLLAGPGGPAPAPDLPSRPRPSGLPRPGCQLCRGIARRIAALGRSYLSEGRGPRRGAGPRPSGTPPQRRGIDERRRADGGLRTQPQAVAGPRHHGLLHDLHPRVGRLVRHRGHGLVLGAGPHHPAAHPAAHLLEHAHGARRQRARLGAARRGRVLRLGAARPGRLLGVPDGLVVVALDLRRLVGVRRARRRLPAELAALRPDLVLRHLLGGHRGVHRWSTSSASGWSP